MIRYKENCEIVKNVNMRGGDGTVLLRHLLNKDEFNEKGRLFAQITVAPNCSVGYHEHHGETEIYTVISGSGIFNDNGNDYTVTAGDVLITKSGQGHGIACSGNVPLELIALIIYD